MYIILNEINNSFLSVWGYENETFMSYALQCPPCLNWWEMPHIVLSECLFIGFCKK